jgi:hypothetical protein
MKRQLLILSALSAMLIGMPMESADAAHGFGGKGGHGTRVAKSHGHGHGHGKGFGRGHRVGRGHGFGQGLAFGAFLGNDSDLAELYRELDDNLPYFALHPPVYYSHVVPRPYGYSPFAYLPNVLTPEVVPHIEPVTIMNPYVPRAKETKLEPQDDRAAAIKSQPEPLVIINPFVGPNRSVARAER